MGGLGAALVPSMVGAKPVLLVPGTQSVQLGEARVSISWEETALRLHLTSPRRAAVNGRELATDTAIVATQGDLIQVEDGLWEVLVAPNLAEMLPESPLQDPLRDAATRLYGRRVFEGVLDERLARGEGAVLLLKMAIQTDDRTLVLRGRLEIANRAARGHGGRIYALERDVLAVIDPVSQVASEFDLVLWGQLVCAEVWEKQFTCERAAWSSDTIDDWLAAMREPVAISSA